MQDQGWADSVDEGTSPGPFEKKVTSSAIMLVATCVWPRSSFTSP